MQFSTFDIAGPVLLTPKRFGDTRGYFSETWNRRSFAEAIGDVEFVQDNVSLSERRGTLRGLHWQHAPFAQGKLVRVQRGRVFDVAVDARPGSPTFGRHVAVELSAENWAQLWIPPGFLHGFCTLSDATEFVYKVTAFYSADHDGGVVWNDPDLGIAWPVPEDELTLSEKDRRLPRLRDLTGSPGEVGQGA